MTLHQTKAEQLIRSSEFKQLVKHRWTVSLLLTAIMFFSYMGFLYVLAYQKESLSPYVTGKFTIGLVFAIGLIFLAWMLTGIYVYWANNTYNPEVERLKNKLQQP
ncbi:MAG TPA: DUF485 domain-containing protein [Cytophagaceae bacterium]|jgi:uncharacterized membrane protein (DUF485 family)|nr:DUF485 domain-containing protein [Cytophagaceae bacterium]